MRLPEWTALPPPLDEGPSRRAFRLGLFAAAAVLFVFYMWVSWTQWRAGQVLGDPVTTFDLILSRNAAGDWFDHPRRPGNHYFTNHAMLWMIPATLPYLVADSAFTYIAMINLALALSVVPLGLLARRITASEPVAWGIVTLWSLNTLTASLLFSLHCENLGFPAWFLLFWAVTAKRPRVQWIAACLLMLVKQDYAVWLAVYAAWAGVSRHLPWRQAARLLVFACVSYAGFKVLMDVLPHEGSAEVGYYWVADRYGGIATTPAGLVAYFAAHPLELAARLARPAWIAVVLAGGVVCVLGWRAMLMTLPPAFLFFTAAEVTFFDLRYYYCYPLLPPVFLAACEGCRWLLARGDGDQVKRRASILAGWLVLVAAAQLALPSRADGRRLRSLPPDPRMEAARLFIERHVSPDDNVTVMAQWQLAAFVPRGAQRVTMGPAYLPRATMVVLDTDGFLGEMGVADWRALMTALEDPAGSWELRDQVGTFILFARRPAADAR